MNAIAIATRIGAIANTLAAQQRAEQDLRWWAKQIGKAAARGETSCEMSLYWRSRPDGYVEALQTLLPSGCKVEQHKGGMAGPDEGHNVAPHITVSWS